ncbi:tRNA lysidine(34) synthetase TilS [Polycladidibacter stylochi]|uniref:tRNA lysidine(34) synthetase TilS n=1 Tax=Polycladidibacter stylochi TaxID=1807766 RepID=UPI00082C11EC|nr:tRNA lysidine(34) synthetase TilS [Pseudovibrio stylochi]
MENTALSAQEVDALFAPLKGEQRIAIGVSGGGDSLALLILCYEWSNRLKTGPEIVVFTVDHGLRQEAAQEAKGVADLCNTLGITHRTLIWQHNNDIGSVQTSAREARLNLLENAAFDAGCARLLLAHHLEDQAETFLSRLARGSGVYGLSAMAFERDGALVKITRPLLKISKDKLLQCLRERGVDWVEDPSNQDRAYSRVRIRQLQPKLDEIGLSVARVTATAKAMNRVRETVQYYVKKHLNDCTVVHASGAVRVELPTLMQAPLEIQLRSLAQLLQGVSGATFTARLESLERTLEEIAHPSFRGGTLSGVQIKRGRAKKNMAALKTDPAKYLYFYKERGRVEIPSLYFNRCEDIVALTPGRNLVWDKRFSINNNSEAHICRYMNADPKQAQCDMIRALGEEDWVKFGLKAPEEWPREAFFTAPLVVFAGQLPYIPWDKEFDRQLRNSLSEEELQLRELRVEEGLTLELIKRF